VVLLLSHIILIWQVPGIQHQQEDHGIEMAWNHEMIQWLQELSLPTLMHDVRTTCHWCTVLMDLCWLEQPECMSQKFEGNIIVLRNGISEWRDSREIGEGGREGVRASALPVHPGTCKTSSNCDLAQLCQVHSLRLFHQQTSLFCNLPQVSAHVLSVLQPPVRSTAICDISKSMHHILSYTKQTSSWALNHYLPSPQYADTSKEHSRYFKILK
jgi:hypothetical protein